MEINSNAPVTARHEITIDAPLESVWRVHTEIDSWPQWNPDIAKAELTGPIAVGTVFRWETAGMEIPSTMGEVVHLKKLAWSGETGGILGIHVWNFWATTEGTCSYGGILGGTFTPRTSRKNPGSVRRLSHSVAFEA
jgi:uncharacterized protein YndB with AHSA1/START domain